MRIFSGENFQDLFWMKMNEEEDFTGVIGFLAEDSGETRRRDFFDSGLRYLASGDSSQTDGVAPWIPTFPKGR